MTAPSNHHDASLDLLAHNQAAWDRPRRTANGRGP